MHHSGGRQNGQSDADRKRKDSIFHTLLVSRRVSPFPPHQKKFMGSIPPHESRSLPDGCLCPGDLGVGRPYHRAGCLRLPAERPERSSLCQVPSASPTFSAAPGNRGKCRLCRCPWLHFPESTEGILDKAFRGSKAASLFQAPPSAGRGPMEMEEGLGVRI